MFKPQLKAAVYIVLCSLFSISCTNEMSVENVDLQVEVTKMEFSSTAQNEIIHVKSNQDWDATCDQSWIKLKKGDGHNGHDHLLISIDNYEEYDDRFADIIITSGEAKSYIQVKQKATRILKMSFNKYEANNKGATFSVEVKSNTEYSIDNNSNWISQAEETKSTSNKVLTFTIAPNTTEQERSATIVVKDNKSELADTLFIHQNETDVFRLISNSAFLVDHNEQNISLEVEQNIKYTKSISENALTWIRETGTRVISKDILTYKILKNDSYVQRDGKITLTSEKGEYYISVLQDYDHTPQGELNYKNITSYLNDEVEYTMSMSLNYNCEVIWSSSDESIASIDNTGKIVPHQKGNATIIGKTTDGKVSKECNLQIKEITEDITMSINMIAYSSGGNCSCKITNNSTRNIQVAYFSGSFNMNYINYEHETELNKVLTPNNSLEETWEGKAEGNKLIKSYNDPSSG